MEKLTLLFLTSSLLLNAFGSTADQDENSKKVDQKLPEEQLEILFRILPYPWKDLAGRLGVLRCSRILEYKKSTHSGNGLSGKPRWMEKEDWFFKKKEKIRRKMLKLRWEYEYERFRKRVFSKESELYQLIDRCKKEDRITECRTVCEKHAQERWVKKFKISEECA